MNNHYYIQGNFLICRYGFNQPLNTIIIPNHVTKIDLGYHFNQSLDDLPTSITYLQILSPEFDQSLDNLPDSITYLAVDGIFTNPIKKFPSNLTHLKLYNSFNHSISHLPYSVTYLKLSKQYDKQIVLDHPENITHLILFPTQLDLFNPYYLLEYRSYYNTFTPQGRCIINRHNLKIKQTPFYDLICE